MQAVDLRPLSRDHSLEVGRDLARELRPMLHRAIGWHLMITALR
jgi:hypothetical protein